MLMTQQIAQKLRERMAMGFDSDDMFQLRRGDQNARGGDKARDHRVGQEIGQKAQTEKPHHQQDQARYEGQCDRRQSIFSRALKRQIAHRRRRHQRDHSHRPHGQCPRRAKDRIGHQRQDRRI